ncbi:hypothetical protein PIB30_030640 [Stylosanthes scabra]|uniref:GRF-type domain-containing protein n=1 Tax=Stylosanthes scabra TaxID=79078 RepID=A0ABU6YBZ9_9FABA|nr:hypothetical protein [Stylosanthes scabra]
MESNSDSSASRRVGGGGRDEHSSSEMQGFFSAKVGHERDGAAPKCHCGVYAVLYFSKMSKNPNRLFFGCPFFKIQLSHCKFFLWLDQHSAKFGRMVEISGPKEEEADADEHFGMLKIENRVADLEKRVALIEKKGNMKIWLVCVCFIVGLIVVYVSNV